MKKAIHPNYNEITATCATCKTVYVLGSSVGDINIEICSNCHPFYTGKQGTAIDSENLIKRFEDRKNRADENLVIKKKKKSQERSGKQDTYVPTQKLTLKDMMSKLK